VGLFRGSGGEQKVGGFGELEADTREGGEGKLGRERGMNNINPKVNAAAAGGGVGSAAGIIVLYAAESITKTDFPILVDASVVTVCAAALAFVGGYVKRGPR
jgi:hypothetical protein